MKIIYEMGPLKVGVGGIEFFLGVPKEVPDELGEKILATRVIKFKKVDDKKSIGTKDKGQRIKDKG